MESKTEEKLKELTSKMSGQTYTYCPYAGARDIEEEIGWEAGGKCAKIAIEFAAQQNKELVEALHYAIITILLQSEGKPIKDLDERISYLQQTLKENGKTTL